MKTARHKATSGNIKPAIFESRRIWRASLAVRSSTRESTTARGKNRTHIYPYRGKPVYTESRSVRCPRSSTPKDYSASTDSLISDWFGGGEAKLIPPPVPLSVQSSKTMTVYPGPAFPS